MSRANFGSLTCMLLVCCQVAFNQRGRNATQLNMAGTGIGTFNDRLRDAVMGGSPFAPSRF